MDILINAIKSHARSLDVRQAAARLGVVVSVDPVKVMARVSLEPEGTLTGWLPILSPWVGIGWGMVCLPSLGDQVLVLPQEADAEHGIVVGALFSTVRPPPAAPSGELWLVHRAGTSIKLCNDGTIKVVGDLHVTGDIFDKEGSLATVRRAHNQHRHTDSRSGQTSTADIQG